MASQAQHPAPAYIVVAPSSQITGGISRARSPQTV